MLNKRWNEHMQQSKRGCRGKLKNCEAVKLQKSGPLKLQCNLQNSINLGKKNREPTKFELKVYKACSMIPKGKVCTYGDLAKFLQSSPRAVGQALRRNPFAPSVPCHRVIAANLELGGYQGQQGQECASLQRKRELLMQEGVVFIGSAVSQQSQWKLWQDKDYCVND
eukprot:TRINITY_DN416_c0_g1_i1.p2 TRINITY_DN416_c0_g1~~TRINITY_DN416_c0_g1_i1.p2  ORF type:complete len:167 (-),score=5.78 TRINITY_DN416_c0_g1_i1:188-688(-)